MNHLLYTAVALALAAVVALDNTFSANLSRAFDGARATDPVTIWEAGMCASFAAMAAIAPFRELRK